MTALKEKKKIWKKVIIFLLFFFKNLTTSTSTVYLHLIWILVGSWAVTFWNEMIKIQIVKKALFTTAFRNPRSITDFHIIICCNQKTYHHLRNTHTENLKTHDQKANKIAHIELKRAVLTCSRIIGVQTVCCMVSKSTLFAGEAKVFLNVNIIG